MGSLARLALPLAATLALPGLAAADEAPPDPASEPAPDEADVEPERPAVTEEAVLLSGTTTAEYRGSNRSNASSWLILPEGGEASGELRLLTTAQPMPTGEPLRLTDIVVSRFTARQSIKGKAEIAGGIDLLPKQPSTSDELGWQGLDVSGRVGIGKQHAAYVAIGGGPLTAEQGYWASTAAGVQRRSRVHEGLSFQLGLGGSMTPLFLDRADGWDTAWVAEVVARGETLFHVEDMWGLWFGFDYAYPVAHAGEPMAGAGFDPQPRVDLRLGTVVSFVDDWDVYAEITVGDRGDMGAPATQLPILQGGFDQRVLAVGVTHHWDGGGSSYDDDDDLRLAF